MTEIDALRAENNRLKAFIAAVHCRMKYGPEFDEATRLTLIDGCLKEMPELETIGKTYD